MYSDLNSKHLLILFQTAASASSLLHMSTTQYKKDNIRSPTQLSIHAELQGGCGDGTASKISEVQPTNFH